MENKYYWCPECASSLILKDDLKTVFCPYCGNMVKVEDAKNKVFSKNLLSYDTLTLIDYAVSSKTIRNGLLKKLSDDKINLASLALAEYHMNNKNYQNASYYFQEICKNNQKIGMEHMVACCLWAIAKYEQDKSEKSQKEIINTLDVAFSFFKQYSEHNKEKILPEIDYLIAARYIQKNMAEDLNITNYSKYN